jgi:oligopeptide transport system substrate-binding protein
MRSLRSWSRGIAALTLLLGGSCAKRAAPSHSAQAGEAPRKVLRVGNGAEPQDLDPQVTTGTPEHRLAMMLFEGLVSEDRQLKIVPAVATTWEISDDGLTYTFHLRDDARWSNGDPVTADDFVRSYQRMLTPELGAEYAYMLWYVVGAKDYNTGKLKDFSQTGFKALDRQTVQLRLEHRTPFLLHLLNHESWFPVHIPTVTKYGGLSSKNSTWTRPEHFVGNGPYALKSWRPHQMIVAERSPTYWDRANVKVDEIQMFPVELAANEEKMYRANQLDITYEVPLPKIAVYQRENPAALRIDPYNGVYFYRFNVARKPFDDVRVRRALALAIDRESLVKNVLRGGEEPA